RGLPPFCMRCGEPATVVKHKRFSWGPGWLVVLLLVGAVCFGPLFWIAIILNLILLTRMRVAVPLCERHRNHWLTVELVLFGGIGMLVLLFCATVVLFVTTRGPDDPQIEVAGWFCAGTIAFFVAMLFPAAILQTRVIQAAEITNRSITLTGVAKEFVRMVE